VVKGSDSQLPRVVLEEVANDGSATGTPAADHRALFLGEDGALHLKDSAAAVTDVGGAGGSTVTEDAAEVATYEATSSGSYTDLATAGPAVTIDVPASGRLLVIWSSQIDNSSILVSVALSGANTVAASDSYAIIISGGGESMMFKCFEGLTPGSTTVTMKYRSSGGSNGAQRRRVYAHAVA
jgi:hypothetical protein